MAAMTMSVTELSSVTMLDAVEGCWAGARYLSGHGASPDVRNRLHERFIQSIAGCQVPCANLFEMPGTAAETM
jgi:hypothetical protein